MLRGIVGAIALSLCALGPAHAAPDLCDLNPGVEARLQQLREAAEKGDPEGYAQIEDELQKTLMQGHSAIPCSYRMELAAFGLELLYGPGNSRRLADGIGALEVATYFPESNGDYRFSSAPMTHDAKAFVHLAHALSLQELANTLAGPSPMTMGPVTNIWKEASVDTKIARSKAMAALSAGMQFFGSADDEGFSLLKGLLDGSVRNPQGIANYASKNPVKAAAIALTRCSGLARFDGIVEGPAWEEALLKAAEVTPGSMGAALRRCAAESMVRRGAEPAAKASPCNLIPWTHVISERHRCERSLLRARAAAGQWQEAGSGYDTYFATLDAAKFAGMAPLDRLLSRYELSEMARDAAFVAGAKKDWRKALIYNDMRTALAVGDWAQYKSSATLAHSSSAPTKQGRISQAEAIQIAILDSAFGCLALARDITSGDAIAVNLNSKVCRDSDDAASMKAMRSAWEDYLGKGATSKVYNDATVEEFLRQPVRQLLAYAPNARSVLYVYSDWVGGLPVFGRGALRKPLDTLVHANYSFPRASEVSRSVSLESVRLLVNASLPFAEIEEIWIRRSAPLITSLQTLKDYRSGQFPAGLAGSSIWHVAAHARSDELTPSKSVIQLSSATTLTTSEIDFGLRSIPVRNLPRLVVLSACDTARTQYRNLSPSIANVFLARGVDWVIASSWRVDDLATSLLMAKFYEALASGQEVPSALGSAQVWLANASVEEVEAMIAATGRALPPNAQKSVNDLGGDTPFGDPVFWAAFRAYSR